MEGVEKRRVGAGTRTPERGPGAATRKRQRLPMLALPGDASTTCKARGEATPDARANVIRSSRYDLSISLHGSSACRREHPWAQRGEKASVWAIRILFTGGSAGGGRARERGGGACKATDRGRDCGGAATYPAGQHGNRCKLPRKGPREQAPPWHSHVQPPRAEATALNTGWDGQEERGREASPGRPLDSPWKKKGTRNHMICTVQGKAIVRPTDKAH